MTSLQTWWDGCDEEGEIWSEFVEVLAQQEYEGSDVWWKSVGWNIFVHWQVGIHWYQDYRFINFFLRAGNVIIGSCNEYTKDPDSDDSEDLEPRYILLLSDWLLANHTDLWLVDTMSYWYLIGCCRLLGLAMVPGHHIKQLWVDSNNPTSSLLNNSPEPGQEDQDQEDQEREVEV